MFAVEVREKLKYYQAIELADAGDMVAFVKHVVDTIVKEYTIVSPAQ
jgi:hypothetical protein